jgi:hypothetical protein
MTLTIGARGLFFGGGEFDVEAFNERLSVLGGEGWELVSVFDTNMAGHTRHVVAVLKRALR